MRIPIVSAGALLLAATPGFGGLITCEFTGVITEGGAGGSLAGLVNPGDSIWGQYSFDPSNPDTAPDDPTVGLYQSPAASMRVEIASGIELLISGADFQIGVGNGASFGGGLADGYSVYTRTGIVTAGEWRMAEPAGFGLTDQSATAFDADLLPLTPPDPAAFDKRVFTFGGLRGQDVFHVNGTITALTPEPASLGLLTMLIVSSRVFRKH